VGYLLDFMQPGDIAVIAVIAADGSAAMTAQIASYLRTP
jgi:hypothetical protein